MLSYWQEICRLNILIYIAFCVTEKNDNIIEDFKILITYYTEIKLYGKRGHWEKNKICKPLRIGCIYFSMDDGGYEITVAFMSCWSPWKE
jgi:hypothetical protein